MKYYTLTKGQDGLYEAAEMANPTTTQYDKVKTGVTVYDKDGNAFAAGALVDDITKYYASIKKEYWQATRLQTLQLYLLRELLNLQTRMAIKLQQTD